MSVIFNLVPEMVSRAYLPKHLVQSLELPNVYKPSLMTSSTVSRRATGNSHK